MTEAKNPVSQAIPDISSLPYKQAPLPGKDKEQLFKFGQYRIWKFPGQTTFFFKSGMTIDADGAPKAYHPKNKGLDDLKHAGVPGNWWALVTDNLRPDGNPIVQGNDDPAPGYYISMTALYDETKNQKNPRRYVDATQIPYIVLPQNEDGKFLKKAKVELGDFAAVYNGKNGKLAFAIFADPSEFFTGGSETTRFGEGLIALAEALDIDSNPRTGGLTLVYFSSYFQTPEMVSPGQSLFQSLTVLS